LILIENTLATYERSSEMTQETQERITPEEIMERLVPIKDPEIMLSIVDLGLVYDVQINNEGIVDVTITLTTPACPLGPMLIAQIQDALMEAPGVKDVNVELTFTPPWDPRTMASDEIKMQLGIW
jgi:metal-sulfur cluster biosynthetic enzyme